MLYINMQSRQSYSSLGYWWDSVSSQAVSTNTGGNISLLLIIHFESTEPFPIMEKKGINDVVMPSIWKVPPWVMKEIWHSQRPCWKFMCRFRQPAVQVVWYFGSRQPASKSEGVKSAAAVFKVIILESLFVLLNIHSIYRALSVIIRFGPRLFSGKDFELLGCFSVSLFGLNVCLDSCTTFPSQGSSKWII